MLPLVDQNDFPATSKFVYLDAANIALMYRGAVTSIIKWQQDIGENGSIKFDETAEANVFEELRMVAARLFNARPEDIAVGSSATELLSSLAWAILPGSSTNVVSTDVVFPSTIYPWRRVADHTNCEIRFAKGKDSYINVDDIIALIDKNTAIVCVSHVEYTSGQQFNLPQLAEATHHHDALLIVDATQSAGALPIDVTKCGIDSLVCAAYKWLCGPFGAAVMYLAPYLHNELEPGLVGFRSHKDMWDLSATRIEFPKTAKRFEFSTMAFGCARGLTRSIEFLLDIGIDRICKYNQYLADVLTNGLRERGIEIILPNHREEHSSIVTARFPTDSVGIAQKLREAQVIVSCRSNAIRFSPHVYNTRSDIEKALNCIDAIL